MTTTIPRENALSVATFMAGFGGSEAEALMSNGPVMESPENIFHVTALNGASATFEYDKEKGTRKQIRRAIEEFCLRNFRGGPLKISCDSLHNILDNYQVVNYSGDHTVYVCENETGKAFVKFAMSHRNFAASVMKFRRGEYIGTDNFTTPFGDSLFDAREEVYENIRASLREFFMS